jgi:DNA-binding NtrC family response regulator
MEHYKNLNIHVIEQNNLCRERMLTYLREMGFNHSTAFNNADDCLDSIRNTKPEVVILSENQDAWTSFDVLRNIKRINPDAYVIYLADSKDSNLLVNAQNFGAFDYLFKSHQLDMMMHISLQKVLDVMDLLKQKPAKSRVKFMTLFTL